MLGDGEASTSQLAPSYRLLSPLVELAGIEYPATVVNTNKALKTLGGLNKVSNSLDHTLPNQPVDPAHTIEFSLNRANVFAHPVPAWVTHTGNVVVKLTKRRRKVPIKDADGNVVESGVFITEVCGVCTKTVRFRAMADFQHYAKPKDSVALLADSIRNFNVDQITNFTFDPPKEEYTRDSFLPPPVFSRMNVPQPWNLGPVPASVKTTTINQRGEEVERYINTSRWKAKNQPTIAFADSDVPTGPIDKPAQYGPNVAIEKQLLELFEQRPVWTRTAITNQLDEADARVMINQKHALPVVSYTFSDGPFRDLCIKYGYDPRTDPQARFYQHMVLRNTDNIHNKNSISKPAPRGKAYGERDNLNQQTHLFDGQTIHSTVGNYQLCDISDPLIKNLIHAPEAALETCSARLEGWFEPESMEQIRNVLRRKFIGLCQGREVTDQDCADLLGDPKAIKEAKAKVKGRPRTRTRTREVESAEAEPRSEAGVRMTSEVEGEVEESDVEGMSVDEGSGVEGYEDEAEDAGEQRRRQDEKDEEGEEEKEEAASEAGERASENEGVAEPAQPAQPVAMAVATPARPVRAAPSSTAAETPLASGSKPNWVKAKKRPHRGPKKRTETEEERRERLSRLIGGMQQGGAEVAPSSEAGAGETEGEEHDQEQERDD